GVIIYPLKTVLFIKMVAKTYFQIMERLLPAPVVIQFGLDARGEVIPVVVTCIQTIIYSTIGGSGDQIDIRGKGVGVAKNGANSLTLTIDGHKVHFIPIAAKTVVVGSSGDFEVIVEFECMNSHELEVFGSHLIFL